MTSDDQQPHLIFFDTFSRDAADATALDLIQFRSPVRIHEIRIIPLGARIAANFPNGDRLGATNPSAFDIHFFVNDLSKPSSSVFTAIGSIGYRQNENILIQLIDRPPTDGLLFRGAYQILTIAVFGEPSDLRSVRNPPHLVSEVANDVPPHASPPSSQSTAEPAVRVKAEKADTISEMGIIGDESQTTGMSERSPVSDFGKPIKSCLSVEDMSSPSRSNASFRDVIPGSPLSSSGLPDESNDTEDPDPVSPLNPELLENISPDASPLNDTLDDDADSISDDDLPIGNDDDNDEDDDDVLEEISSDDDPVTSDPVVEEGDDVVPDVHDDEPDHLIFFNPAAASFDSLPDIYDPCRKHRISLDDESFRADVRRVVRDLDPSLERDVFHVLSHADCESQLANIVSHVRSAIDLTSFSASQSEAGKVRQFKSAIKLLIILIRQSEQLQHVLHDSHILSSLLTMFHSDLLNLPFRLIILALVDVAIDDPSGMRRFLFHPHASGGRETGYQWLLRLFLTGPCTRLLVGMTALLQKCNFFVALCDLREGDPTHLSSIQSYLTTYSSFMKQQIRLLPASAVFERRSSRTDARILFRWFENTDFLSLLAENSETSVPHVSAVISLIISLPDGLSFLTTGSRTVICNKVIRSLFVNGDTMVRSLASDVSYQIHANHLLLSLHHIACIRSKESKSNDFEPCLHKLYMLMFNAAGIKSLVTVFSDDHLLKLFLSVITSERVNCGILFDCLTDILIEVIVHRRHEVAKLFLKNGKRLQKLSENENLSIVQSWIEPLEILTPIEYNSHYFDRIMKYICAQADMAEDGMSPQVVNSLRILMDTCVPKQRAKKPEDLLSVRELKYEFAVLQIYSRDGLHILLNMVDSIATSQADSIILLDKMSLNILMQQLLPAVQIIQVLLHQLMDVRRNDFTDCTPVPILMSAHSMLCTTERIATNPLSILIKQHVIEILSLYLSVFVDQHKEPIDSKKSMGCKMLCEVINFTLSCPTFSASGLRVLNSLLPDPVTVSLDQISNWKEDCDRRLWSLHLEELGPEMGILISSLCCSTGDVQSELFALIVRLSDLSVGPAESCCTAILKSMDRIPAESEAAVTNWLTLVNHLLESPSFRVAIAHHLFHGQASTTTTKLIKVMHETKNQHILQQLLQLWSKLLNIRNGLEGEEGVQNQANLLPAADVMSQTLSAAFHVMHLHAYEMIAVAFLSLLDSLSGHDPGLSLMQKEMTQVREQEVFMSLANLIISSIGSSNSLCATHVPAFIALCDSCSRRGIIAWHLVQKVQSLISSFTSADSAFRRHFESLKDPLIPFKLLLPRPEPLSLIFARRRIPKDRKILIPPGSTSVYETIDLLSVSKSLTPHFDLVRSLESSLPPSGNNSRKAVASGKRKLEEVTQQQPPFNSKKQMVAPIRSRAYAPRQGHNNNNNNTNNNSSNNNSNTSGHAGRSNDPFRSRPPNTSRPPSMHVDDFVAMEQRDSGAANAKKKLISMSSASGFPASMKQQKVATMSYTRSKRSHVLTTTTTPMHRDDGKRNVR